MEKLEALSSGLALIGAMASQQGLTAAAMYSCTSAGCWTIRRPMVKGAEICFGVKECEKGPIATDVELVKNSEVSGNV